MSGNGHVPLETRKANVASRFMDLFRTPTPPAPKPVAPVPTHEELVAEAMREWAGRAPATFWQEIDRWVKTAHTTSRSNVRDQFETVYNLGFEAAIEQIRDKFNDWRGQSAPSDPQGEKNG